MALIANIVESAASALSRVALGFAWSPDKMQADLVGFADVFKDKAMAFAEEHPTITALGAVTNPASLVGFTALGLGNPKTFAVELLDKYTQLLSGAFGLLNVEVAQTPEGATADIADQLEAVLKEGRTGAQERVFAAVSLINFIVVTGSAISVAAEVASLGQVDTIADAIQSWVWANGLASFTPMAFTPQINASVSPYLNRYYNSRAQAQIPAQTDIIRMQLREVFDETRRPELVGTEDRPIYNALMREWGFNQFHADSYWGAHWVLPSITQLNEMLFRNVISLAEWERQVKFNDYAPTAIPWLQQIIYNTYTRVDVRRMADLGVLDENEQLQAYADLGNYADTQTDRSGRTRAVFKANPDFTIDKAQALVVFTRLFNALPDLRARYRNGWLSPDELMGELIATGIPQEKAQIQWEAIVKVEQEARIAPEKQLTRAMVARAWRLRLISFEQGIFLLLRMGWSRAEGELILQMSDSRDPSISFPATDLGGRLLDEARRASDAEAEMEGV